MFKKLLAIILTLMFSATVWCLPKQSPTPAWIPPNSRLNEKVFFAPRPSKGNNIFKGNAERWLADAIAELEVGYVAAIDDAFVAQYVAEIGKHLVAHSATPSKNYEFIVTQNLAANAWTAGGGRIYINLGMLKEVETEDELAGVIAHEIGHDAFGHAPKTVTRQMFWMKGVRKLQTRAEVKDALAKLLNEFDKKPLAAIGESLVGFSRIDELEADRAAFYTLYKAGYNPRALSTLMKRMKRNHKQEEGGAPVAEKVITLLFGSHPPTAQRTTAFSWESNFVKMPQKDATHSSTAFNAMKVSVNAEKKVPGR
jgi:predicted Zn-dependent protease